MLRHGKAILIARAQKQLPDFRLELTNLQEALKDQDLDEPEAQEYTLWQVLSPLNSAMETWGCIHTAHLVHVCTSSLSLSLSLSTSLSLSLYLAI